jgi:hypothetical protein
MVASRGVVYGKSRGYASCVKNCPLLPGSARLEKKVHENRTFCEPAVTGVSKYSQKNKSKG